ncbi:MAG: PD40 domain-containing protein [bacterium]|nr:PD40 domain-containing protein [bacterium]
MRKIFILAVVLFAALAGSVLGQETAFGKNKVQYKNFEWFYIQSRHFDIHYYENAYPTAKFTAAVLESSYVEISKELNYHIQRRVPVFLYNSHSDFQQTNIYPALIPEGVGGFTEAFKNRIVIPFTGSYEDLRHVLHHELTHAVVYDLVYGNLLGSIISRQRLFDVPLWFAEGYAEYSSRHGWDYFSDMFVRDATINGYLAPPDYLGGFLAYKQGQAMVKYIADKYGEEKLGEILQKGRVHLTMAKAIKSALNIEEQDFWEDFSKEMKRRYWPQIAQRKEADEIATQLTKAREDGSYFNEQPTYSPEGDKIAIFSDKSDATEIVLIAPADGRVLDRLIKGERSADLESLHSFVSGMSFSPDGRKIVFVAKSKGKDALMFLDVRKKKIYKRERLDFYNVISPAWSPDGKSVAFSALDGYKRDLYLYDIETGAIKQLTDDRFDDGYPSWFPNSQGLVYQSDRPHPSTPVLDPMGHPYIQSGAFKPGDFAYGDYNLFKLELSNNQISPIDVGPGANRNPKVSPDGSMVAFVSNRNGIDNLYIGYLDSVKYYAVTDILTGVQTLSWSPDGKRIAFSAFFNGAFDIFTLKDMVPAGDNGVLSPTDFVLGKYNLLDSSGVAIASKSPKEPKDVQAGHMQTADTAPIQAAADSTTPSDSLLALDSLKAATDTLAAVTPDSALPTAGDTLAAVMPDSTLAATSDTLASTDKPKADSSGIVGDEYVYVSSRKRDPLDSLFDDIRTDDTSGGSYRDEMPLEPAVFDSVQGILPSGEYAINKYKVKFTPDYVGGGFAYDTFFGLRGQSYFVFSDYLGNHQIYLATDLVNTIDQSNVQAYYFNNTKRLNWGGGIFHTKNYYLDNYDYLFSDRFYGFQAFLARPFSTFSRVDLIAAQYFIDRRYYDLDDPRFGDNRSSKVTTGTLSYVTDNVLWGMTGPVTGRRTKVSLSAGINLFDASDIEYYSLEADYRKYWHLGKQFSFAFRVAGGGSTGNTPKQYFLGGTTNWIGNRTLDAKVYDVENLYFSDVVTPLRGVEYYDLSGNRFGLVNMEFRFPMIQYFVMRFPLPIVIANVSGAIFSDIGSAWYDSRFKGGTTSEGRNRLQDIKSGFGFGMRANLFNFVLLRYDVAWQTDFYDVSEKAKHYFSFGADF